MFLVSTPSWVLPQSISGISTAILEDESYLRVPVIFLVSYSEMNLICGVSSLTRRRDLPPGTCDITPFGGLPQSTYGVSGVLL